MNNYGDSVPVELFVTSLCNQRCEYCYASGITENGIIHMDYSDIDAVVNYLDNFNAISVDIMGGEPTLHPDIEGIIEYLYEKGIEEVKLFTNLTRPKVVHKLMNLFPKLNVVSSLHIEETMNIDGWILSAKTLVRLFGDRVICPLLATEDVIGYCVALYEKFHEEINGYIIPVTDVDVDPTPLYDMLKDLDIKTYEPGDEDEEYDGQYNAFKLKKHCAVCRCETMPRIYPNGVVHLCLPMRDHSGAFANIHDEQATKLVLPHLCKWLNVCYDVLRPKTIP